MVTDEDRERAERQSKARVDAIVALFSDLSENEWREVLDEIRGRFCIECGSDDPRCQCWNDE